MASAAVDPDDTGTRSRTDSGTRDSLMPSLYTTLRIAHPPCYDSVRAHDLGGPRRAPAPPPPHRAAADPRRPQPLPRPRPRRSRTHDHGPGAAHRGDRGPDT